MIALPYTFTDQALDNSDRLVEVSLDKAHEGDAGFDLRAAASYAIYAAETIVADTGVRIALPEDFCGLVLPRSGLASKFGLTIPNAPGLIDSGYRGEIRVPLYLQPTQGDIYSIAQGREPRHYQIEEGNRIAQLIIVEVGAVSRAAFVPPERFQAAWGETERGEGGFGSSGR